MDMFVSPGITADEIRERLNRALPRGLHVLEARLIEPKSPSLSTLIESTRYRITLGESWSARLGGLCGEFLGRDTFVIQRRKKGDVQSIDLRQELTELTAHGPVMELVCRRGKALEFVHAITGDRALGGDDIRVEKMEVIFST
jgi:radical SAM-linked protein